MLSKPQRQFLVSVIVGVAFFMHGLDSTITTTAVPHMALSFGINPVRLDIAIVSYILSMAVFVPISGWLADRFGASVTFASAIGIFTLASLLCGLSNNIVELTAARVLQGAGAAMMIPVGRLVVLHNIPKSDYIRALVIVGLFPTLGMMLGPPVGGFISTYANWRWVFLINLPVGIIGVLLVLFCVENFRAPERRPLDWMGFILTGVALSAIIYGFEGIGRGAADFKAMAPAAGFRPDRRRFRHLACPAGPEFPARSFPPAHPDTAQERDRGFAVSHDGRWHPLPAAGAVPGGFRQDRF